MIRLAQLTFGYSKHKPLFRGISLELSAGNIVGLLGRNGEGKSTLMKLLTGQLVAGEGVLEVLGLPSCQRKTELLQQVYMLHEDVQAPRITVREYFDIFTPFYPTYDELVAREIMQAFEADWRWNLAKVSLGQRKKCLIALALSLRTPLVLLDEPTNGLDIPSKSVFRRLLVKYTQPEQTIIISTHQVRDLEQVIDHIVMLDQNRIVCNRSIAELVERLTFAPVTPERADSALYREPMMMGEYGIWERSKGDSDAEDFSMELFFNAMIAERERLQHIIEQDHHQA